LAISIPHFNSLGRLDHPLYRALAHDNYPREYRLLAIESVLRPGKVPVQGCRHTSLGLEAPERIEMKIDAETEIDITLNEITLRHGYGIPGNDGVEIARFKRVRADLASVEQCLRENILRADHVVDEPKAAGDEAQDDVEDGVETYALLDKPPSGGQLVFIESGIGTAPGTSAPKPRARPQRDEAKHLLQNMFPNGMPPKDKLPPCALLAKCKGPEWDGLKRDSIGRAAKELREAAPQK
jgi:hypothetical protein